ncbi:MAG: cytochrome c oxidase subunit 3, partial [Rhodospirillaceae bacterium]|nr:cytochrome c oxidase subunit 3 [Rhodospirillaceae bacterium]
MSETVLHDRPLPVGSIGRHASGWWAMVGLILTEGSLFVYLLFSYYYFAVQPQQDWPPGGLPHFRLSLPNTVILLASSLAVWWGQRAARRGATLRLVAGLAIGLVLGAVFVGIQFLEWYGKPFALASHPYGSLYYTITGFHMAHVAVGLLILAALILWL